VTCDVAIQLAAFEFDMHAIAALHGRRIANDRGAVFVPADRIPTGEDRKRTEAFEPRGRPPQARVRRMHLPVHRGAKAAVDTDKPSAGRAKAAANVKSLECQPQHLIEALPTPELPTHGAEQLVRQIVRTAAAHRNAHGKTGVAGPRLKGSKPGANSVKASLHQRLHAMSETIDARAEVVLARHHHFRRG